MYNILLKKNEKLKNNSNYQIFVHKNKFKDKFIKKKKIQKVQLDN